MRLKQCQIASIAVLLKSVDIGYHAGDAKYNVIHTCIIAFACHAWHCMQMHNCDLELCQLDFCHKELSYCNLCFELPESNSKFKHQIVDNEGSWTGF